MQKIRIGTFAELDPTTPSHAVVAGVDLVIVRWPDGDEVSVLYGSLSPSGRTAIGR
jgi:hypothetical protein